MKKSAGKFAQRSSQTTTDIHNVPKSVLTPSNSSIGTQQFDFTILWADPAE